MSRLAITGTYWFEKKDMLMIGFAARVHRRDFQLSDEVDQAVWVPPQEALSLLHPAPAISYLVTEHYLRHPDILEG